MVNVICMKWGVKFGPEYVNRLRSMVARHLKQPHRFVCFTDDAKGVEPGVEVLPLPDMDLPPGKERCWRKMTAFGSPLADLQGPTLFLDLDVVIVGSIDCFFEHPGKFLIIRDWAKPWRTGNSSVFRFEAGAHPDLLAKFLADLEAIRAKARSDQEFITWEMKAQGHLDYWPASWCASFKHTCLPMFPLNLFSVPTVPPDTRIVVFHGVPKPEDAIAGRGKGLFRYVRPTPWVAEAWR